MEYQVWTKEEYGDLWKRVDCEDLAAVRRVIDAVVRLGQEPIITVEVPYELSIKISAIGEEPKSAKQRYAEGVKDALEGGKVEADKDKTELGEGPGVKSKGKVRPGATDTIPELS